MSDNDDEPDTHFIAHLIAKPCAYLYATINDGQNNNFTILKAYFIVLS